MYTKNMMINDIEAAKLTAHKAMNEANAIRETAPLWQIESLEECAYDAMEAAADLTHLLRETEAGEAFAKGLCPECLTKSDMPDTYCSDCQQTAGERMGRCE